MQRQVSWWLLLFVLASRPMIGQVWLGPALMATYVAEDKAVLPGLGGHVSGGIGERLRWRGAIAWHVPRATSSSYTTGPRLLAVGADTNLQNVDAHHWNGLCEISASLIGRLGKLHAQRGVYWHAGMSLYARTSRYTYEAWYVYSNVRMSSEGVNYGMHLGLPLGMGYRARLGSGEWWAEVGVAPLLLEFRKYARNELHGFLFPTLSLGYDWKL